MKKHSKRVHKDGETFILSSDVDEDSLDTDSLVESSSASSTKNEKQQNQDVVQEEIGVRVDLNVYNKGDKKHAEYQTTLEGIEFHGHDIVLQVWMSVEHILEILGKGFRNVKKIYIRGITTIVFLEESSSNKEISITKIKMDSIKNGTATCQFWLHVS